MPRWSAVVSNTVVPDKQNFEKGKRVSSPANPFQPDRAAAQTGSAPVGGGPAGASSLGGDTLTIAGPPTGILASAAGLAAVGVGVAVTGLVLGSWIAILGWALAGPLAIAVMGLFIKADTERRAEPVYMRPDWMGIAYAVVVGLSVIGVLVGAWGFANVVGRW